MKILITGFEPFMNRTKNPSMDVLALLENEKFDHSLKTLVLPVVFDDCFEILKETIDRDQPDVVLLLGLAEDRKKITLERVAINVKDARVADNKGQAPIDQEIVTGGQAAYFSTLPLRTFESTLQAKNIPVALSSTAGTYVCNNIMYHTLHYLSEQKLNHVQAGFIHLPLMQEQVDNGANAMPLDTIKEAISSLINSYS